MEMGIRIGLILSNGEHVFGDQLLAIFAQGHSDVEKGYIVQDISAPNRFLMLLLLSERLL